MKDAVDRLGYEWEYDDDYVPQFTFAAEGYRAEYEDAEDAVTIRPGGTKSNAGGYGAYNPYFEYNKEDNLYYRFQDGKKQIDEMNNKQLTVSNVVFQYCHGEVRDAKDYLAFGVPWGRRCPCFYQWKSHKRHLVPYGRRRSPSQIL